MAAIFYLPVTLTSEIIRNSPAVLLDHANVGVVVEILLLFILFISLFRTQGTTTTDNKE